ncbi:hypothetical protein DPMN_182756 [Dreissena polymorpha]|uniref:Uncharacterized protein n=1 Tax=Dreissena polymorpha TaxID=45954 RepID=A0A9D4I6G1_DREPO|nr:hypothetical protein DPMN_182756 [Dreissena polymorpha]
MQTRQSYGTSRLMLAESRYSYGTSVNRRSAGTPPAFTGAPPGHYRRRSGLNRGVAVALPAKLRYTGALPGRFRLSPGLHRGITGDSRGFAGASPG